MKSWSFRADHGRKSYRCDLTHSLQSQDNTGLLRVLNFQPCFPSVAMGIGGYEFVYRVLFIYFCLLGSISFICSMLPTPIPRGHWFISESDSVVKGPKPNISSLTLGLLLISNLSVNLLLVPFLPLKISSISPLGLLFIVHSKPAACGSHPSWPKV